MQPDQAAPQRADFYVYILFRENGVPFYVGKGRGRRLAAHECAARRGAKGHRFSIIRDLLARGLGVECRKVHEGLTDAEAIALEVAWIAEIGRKVHGGPLVNETDGGDGMSGYQMPDASRAHLSAIARGIKKSPETVTRMKDSWKSRPAMTDETKAKLSASLKGRPLSPEHRAKVLAAREGRQFEYSQERRAKAAEIMRAISAGNIGRKRPPMSDAQRAKLSAAAKARVRKPHSPEARANMAAAAKNRRRVSASENVQAERLAA